MYSTCSECSKQMPLNERARQIWHKSAFSSTALSSFPLLLHYFGTWIHETDKRFRQGKVLLQSAYSGRLGLIRALKSKLDSLSPAEIPTTFFCGSRVGEDFVRILKSNFPSRQNVPFPSFTLLPQLPVCVQKTKRLKSPLLVSSRFISLFVRVCALLMLLASRVGKILNAFFKKNNT